MALGEREAAQAELARQATHCAVTGLINRTAFVGLVDLELSAEPDATAEPALILIGLGALDPVSDRFGHEVADQVVVHCARTLEAAAHDGDVVARASDHNFAIWCPHGLTVDEALHHAERLRGLLVGPHEVAGADIRLFVAAAVASASTTEEHVDAAEVMHRAHTALSRARRDRTTQVYDRSMRDEVLRQIEVQALVDRAIASGVVALGYQPMVRLLDQRTVGAEALLRMVDDHGEPVSPIEVVRAAERSGRIGELGDLILRTACGDAAGWNRARPERPLRVAVNLSARQLDDRLLGGRVAAALVASGLDPGSLSLEVTETAIMTDPLRSATILADLKAQGIRLSADDFGTGYSSLAHLKALPLDEVKIDRSFVAGLPEQVEDIAIATAILALADALGLAVVAEGVETAANLAGLRTLGTELGQGYLWSPALPDDQFRAWLDREDADGPTPDPVTSIAPTAVPAPVAAGAAAGQPDLRLLLVSGDAEIRKLAPRLLLGRGITVTTTATVREGVADVQGGSFDLAVLDVALADGSGLEVLTALRATGSEAHVIVLTGPTSELDRIHAFHLGADDVVVKPFFTRELAARLSSVTRRLDLRDTGARQFGDLCIQPTSRCVTLTGAPVQLTAMEFDLLAFLSAHPDQVFTRDQLLHSVWRSAAAWQRSSTVTEHVRRLRVKTEADPRVPVRLLTVRGIGYRFTGATEDTTTTPLTKAG